MRTGWVVVLGLGLLGAVRARGDVTVRMRNQVTLAAPLEAMVPATGVGAAILQPFYTVLAVAPGEYYTRIGPLGLITNMSTGKVVMLDFRHDHVYSQALTVPPGAGAGKAPDISALPPAVAQELAAIHLDVSARDTGRQDTVGGVAVEETEITWSLTTQAGMPAMVRGVLDLWRPTAAALAASAALREWQDDFKAMKDKIPSNPLMSQLTNGPLAPLASQLKPITDAFASGAPVLKTHLDLYSAMILQMLAGPTAGGRMMPGLDPGNPLLTYDSEITNISAGDDAADFQIPAGFSSVPQDQFFHDLIPLPTLPAGALGGRGRGMRPRLPDQIPQ